MVKAFDFWTKQLCERSSCSQDLMFSESANNSKISNVLRDVNNLNSIARPYQFDELRCGLLVGDNQVT